MKRWKITIEYDGTDYYGWQKQPDVSTIQTAIENAIKKFCGQDIDVKAAGRTDAGVHAHGQVAHFDFDWGNREIDAFNLAKAINAHLHPAPIAVVHAEEIHADFNARFDALNKLYRYRIVTRRAMPLMEPRVVWHFKHHLDIDAMREGAKHLIGHHDFSSFRDAQCQAKTPMRTLDRVGITTKPYDPFGGEEIWIELEGPNFIHHQCRNIVGTLVDVGRGKTSPDDIATILKAKDRTKAGMTAPAKGLSLFRIDY
ncbi:MAG: tRNA pseudouridine(38-40) synthase TruA [Alphaproteobacteria bacterium]|nr:MAG: tRNA pseudouridine(38-40) synthase TruA [Alphaproteobacteria bacterium]